MPSSTPRLSLAAAIITAMSFIAMSVAGADTKDGSFQSSDGHTIRYWEAAGPGAPIVMIPGWSQTAAQFDKQKDLADTYKYHVFALDMRGHGESDKPNTGYRIDRLAEDLNEFLISRNLTDVTLLGHSMGAAVTWGYWKRFGKERLAKLIIVEQGPYCVTDNAGVGGPFPNKEVLSSVARSIERDRNGMETEKLLQSMFTKVFQQEEAARFADVVKQNLKFPRPQAAGLLREYCKHDWSKVLKTITIPTLIVGGAESRLTDDTWRWMTANIPGSRVEIFKEAERGSHFMFMENPEKFNRTVHDFVK